MATLDPLTHVAPANGGRARRLAAGAGGAAALGLAYGYLVRPRLHRWGATADDLALVMPGDDIVRDPFMDATHAISIRARPAQVWPWLVQMGSGRAGWYSYDLLDNDGAPSAERVVPELQDLAVGDLLPMLPGAGVGPRVQELDPPHAMLWGEGEGALTWAWRLLPEQGGTRLVSRVRARFPWNRPLFGLLADAGDAVMMRKLLRGVKRRAERMARAEAVLSGEPVPLIDRVMPAWDRQGTHEVLVQAPADVVFETACTMDLHELPMVRTLFRIRDRLLGGPGTEPEHPVGLVAETRAMGWRELASRPGRELVMGAAAQPWLADPGFTPLAPEEFAAYDEPDRVKIAWTLEAEPLGPSLTRFRTRTRVLATDDAARHRFRRYWRVFGAGIVLIRLVMLPALRREAERRAGEVRPAA